MLWVRIGAWAFAVLNVGETADQWQQFRS